MSKQGNASKRKHGTLTITQKLERGGLKLAKARERLWLRTTWDC